MNLGPKVDSSRVVGEDGYVSVKGHRVGQVARMKTSRKWIYRAPGGVYSQPIYGSQEEAVDGLFAHLQGGGVV